MQIREHSTRTRLRAPADLDYPFGPAPDAPDAPLVESAARAWVLEHRLAAAADVHKRFDPLGGGLLTSLCYPGSSLEKRVLFAQLLGWIFVQDDEVDDAVEAHDPAALAARYTRFVGITRGAPADPSDPFLVALAELCERIRAGADAAWYDAFADSLRRFWLDGVVEEARARKSGALLPPAQYMRVREHSIGLFPFLDFVETAHGFFLPRDVVADARVQQIRRGTARLVTYANDVFSFEKERRAGDANNLVHIMMALNGASLASAVDVVIAIHDRELAELCAAIDAVERDASTSPDLLRYLAGHKHWLRGALEWQRRSLRYARGRALLAANVQ